MTRARALADLANSGVFSPNAGLKRVGINSTSPGVTLDVGGGASFSGNVSVGGTLTYDDVTNIDSVGIVTARSGIHIDDSIVHIGDTNTKIRFPANDTITAETSGKERVRINSNGRVAIGTPSDTDHTLCVAGTDDTTSLTGGHSQGIQLQNKSTTDGTYSQIEWRTSSGGRYARIAGIQDDANGNGGQLVFLAEESDGTTTERLRIASDGKIGISNASPTYRVSVKDTKADGTGVQLHLWNNSTNNTPGNVWGGIRFTGSTADYETAEIKGWRSHPGTNLNSLSINTGGTERMVLSSSGVGIGTINPNMTLHVLSSSDDVVRFQSSSAGNGPAVTLDHIGSSPADADTVGKIVFNGKNDADQSTTYADIKAITTDVSDSSEDGDITFSTRSDGTFAERMRLVSNGDIDLTGGGNIILNEDSKLYLEGDADDLLNAIWKSDSTDNTLFLTSRYNIANVIDSNDDDTASYWSVRHNGTTLGTSGELMRVQSQGQVLIGTSSLIDTSVASNLQVASASGSRICIARNDQDTDDGNLIGALDFYGNHTVSAGGYELIGRMLCEASENHTDGSKATDLVFYTCKSTTDSATEKLRITDDGKLKHNSGSDDTEHSDYAGFIQRPTQNSAGIYYMYGGTNRTANGTNKIATFHHGYWGGAREVGAFGFETTSSTGGSGHGYGSFIVYTGESGNGDGGSTSTERLRIHSGGKLTVPGVYAGTTTGGAAVYVESDGDLLRYTSSRKYKTDIETLEDARADAILNCRPVWYKSISANDIKTEGADKSDWGWYGFIAEEVAEIEPRLVNWATKDAVANEKGVVESVERDPADYEAEGVRYDNFVPLLLNLVKRQKAQIEAMETRIAALEG